MLKKEQMHISFPLTALKMFATGLNIDEVLHHIRQKRELYR